MERKVSFQESVSVIGTANFFSGVLTSVQVVSHGDLTPLVSPK